jgi:hypothetical protein
MKEDLEFWKKGRLLLQDHNPHVVSMSRILIALPPLTSGRGMFETH